MDALMSFTIWVAVTDAPDVMVMFWVAPPSTLKETMLFPPLVLNVVAVPTRTPAVAAEPDPAVPATVAAADVPRASVRKKVPLFELIVILPPLKAAVKPAFCSVELAPNAAFNWLATLAPSLDVPL